jgi:excisionase family DNA binding protein
VSVTDSQPTQRRWLSQQEAAEYVGVTDRTIRNWIRIGAVKGRRPPGSRLIRIDRHELDAAFRVVPTAGPQDTA